MMKKALPQGKKIQLKGVRLSFPALAKAAVPAGYDNAEPKFSANFLLDPNDKAHAALINEVKAEVKRLMVDAWGGKPPRMKPIDCCGDGENYTSKSTKKPYAGYEGMFVVSAKNSRRPLCLSKTKEILTPDEVESMLYAGCYVTAIVTFWIQDNQYGEAVRCSLEGVKFVRDGDAFGAAGASADDFDDDDEDGLVNDFDDDIPF